MAEQNYYGVYQNPLLYNKPAELRYGWGYTQIPEIKNDTDLAKIQTQVSNNLAERRAADDELMNANKLAENHPLTNLGIMLGMPLGKFAAYALAESLPKWFGKKNNSENQTPQQNISLNYLTDPQLAQKQFAQKTGQVAISLMPSVNYQRNQNPYGLKTNYFPFSSNGNQTPPTINQNLVDRAWQAMGQKPIQQMASEVMNGYTPPPNYNVEVPKNIWQTQNQTPSIWNRRENFF